MTPLWLGQALATGALLSAGALAAERVAGWFRLPRRWVWAAAMLASLLLPALALWAPGLLPELGILPRPTAAPPSPGPASLTGLAFGDPAAGPGDLPGTAGPSLSSLLALLWAAVTLGLLAGLAWTYRRLRALRAACAAVEVDGFGVRVSERLGPAVVGLLRPVVVLPRWVLDEPEEERRLILLHEREHLAGGDVWLLFLSTLGLALMPWNPLLWWQQRRLRTAVETDCDARVLARGASRRAYGAVLIRTAGSAGRLPLLSPAWGESPSHLERRILTMTAKRPTHRLLRSLPLAALAAGLVLTACDVAGSPEPAAGHLATAPEEAPEVRTVTVQVLDAPPARGTLGFNYGIVGPIRVTPGQPVPERLPVYWTVRSVLAGSSAERAGLRTGDVILAVNGVDSREKNAWPPLVDARPGTEFTLRIRRGDEERTIRSRIDPRPGAVENVPVTKHPGAPTGSFGYALVWEGHDGPRFDPEHGMQPAIAYPKVTGLDPDGAAARGGLKNGDLLLEIADADARGPRPSMDLSPGARYPVVVRRGGRELTLRLTMDARKER
jgi:hypothetical protein